MSVCSFKRLFIYLCLEKTEEDICMWMLIWGILKYFIGRFSLHVPLTNWEIHKRFYGDINWIDRALTKIKTKRKSFTLSMFSKLRLSMAKHVLCSISGLNLAGVPSFVLLHWIHKAFGLLQIQQEQKSNLTFIVPFAYHVNVLKTMLI